MLWKTRGGYKAEVKFNPDIDLREFGSQYGPGMYTATFNFEINDKGHWTADFDYEFEQVDNIFDNREPPPAGRKGPFYAQDFSRMKSNTAVRARKLAKPQWDNEAGRNDMEFWDLLCEEERLNQTVDFSFKYHYTDTGDWSDYKKYERAVSNVSLMTAIPEKEVMYSIPISTIKKS
jgi:hypothetical protein